VARAMGDGHAHVTPGRDCSNLPDLGGRAVVGGRGALAPHDGTCPPQLLPTVSGQRPDIMK